MRLIDIDALKEALMVYTWRDEDGYEIDDAEDKRKFIDEWLRFPDVPIIESDNVYKWTSVKDKLPERWQPVITYDRYFGVKQNQLVNYSNGFAEWWNEGYHVTYWMAMPEPPKEDE